MSLVFLAAIVLLTGAGVVLLPLGNQLRALVSLVSQGIASGLVLFAVGPVLVGGTQLWSEVPWTYPIGRIEAGVDALSAFFLAWSLPMTWLGTLYAVGYLRPQFASRNAGVQFSLLNLTALAFVMIYTLQNATAFLLGWEVAAVAAWLLVIWEYRNQKVRFAGFNYLVSTHIGFFFLVAAFMVMHSQTHSMTFTSFASFLRTPGEMRSVTFLLLVTSFALKSAFFPFHTWLPRAHAAAPAHVSALMSGVIHKAGLFGLLRFTLLMGEPEPWMGWFLICFSSASAIVAVFYTVAQRDLKRLLGYSSTENVGIAGIGLGIGYLGLSWHVPLLVSLGFAGGLLHILNHALFKCLLFYAAGSVYRSTHSVDLERLGGLGRQMPWTSALFLLGGLAISALPPLNGFVSEFVIYSGLLSDKVPAGIEQVFFVCVAALLAFVGGVSALAVTRCFGLTFLGSPRDARVNARGESPWSMRVVMSAHALGIVALGLVPGFGLRLVRAPSALFLSPQDSVDVGSIARISELIAPVAKGSWALIALLAVCVAIRRSLGSRSATGSQVTWGCGYQDVTPRMQYSGASFSASFVDLFPGILPQRRRDVPPEGAFPQNEAQLLTHSVDAVEQRVFEALDEGETLAARASSRISEEPRFSFGLGLLVLGVLVVAALLGDPL
jgi:hydrogenase-4 component B